MSSVETNIAEVPEKGCEPLQFVHWLQALSDIYLDAIPNLTK